MRRGATAALALLQLLVLSAANYGFFNSLTLALCPWGLDDDRRAALRLFRIAPARWYSPVHTTAVHGAVRRALPWLFALAWACLSRVPFFPFVPPLRQSLSGLREVLRPWRTVNAYHLLASMTYVRNEVVLEGSEDGREWKEYVFPYKPGPPGRAPAFVAPHQPRVDFQLWFLLLRGRPPRDRYFWNLVARLLTAPDVVAPLFTHEPFAGRARGDNRARCPTSGRWGSESATGSAVGKVPHKIGIACRSPVQGVQTGQ